VASFKKGRMLIEQHRYIGLVELEKSRRLPSRHLLLIATRTVSSGLTTAAGNTSR